MNNTPIYIPRDDYAKLRLFVTTSLYSNTSRALEKLREELDRAAIVDPPEMPSGIVTLESRVEFEDLGTGEIEDYTITFPERANVDEKRLSILAPVGIALIGCRTGDVVHWSTPGGIRQLKIRHVTPPDPALAAPSAPAFAAVR